MISSILHLVGLRPRVYYNLTNGGAGVGGWGGGWGWGWWLGVEVGGGGVIKPPPQYVNGTIPPHPTKVKET